jgi:hypothetical protein
MDRNDFVKLIGPDSAAGESLPVAFLLRSGYACAGYYHASVNSELKSACVVLNAHLIELQDNHGSTARPSIHDFNDFLEEIVMTVYNADPAQEVPARGAAYGKCIPLAAIPFAEIAVMYPVAHIGALMRRAEEMRRAEPKPQTGEASNLEPADKAVPSFFDLNRSEIIKLLRLKLW